MSNLTPNPDDEESPETDTKIGRPSKYQPEFAQKAHQLCKQGATIREVAEFFNVSESTVRNWSHEHVEFFTALKTGRETADIRVEQALYRRAIGYSHDAVHVSNYQGQVTLTPIVEHYPPDTTAGIFWLKNRKPHEWRDVKAVEHTGHITHRHAIEYSDDELADIIEGRSSEGASDPSARPQ